MLFPSLNKLLHAITKGSGVVGKKNCRNINLCLYKTMED